MLSPGTNPYNVFSPDTGSKRSTSIKSRLELQNVLKEAYAFLSEPDIQYEPTDEDPFQLRDYKRDALSREPYHKPQLPKVESVEEFIKIRMTQKSSNSRSIDYGLNR